MIDSEKEEEEEFIECWDHLKVLEQGFKQLFGRFFRSNTVFPVTDYSNSENDCQGGTQTPDHSKSSTN